LEHNIMNMTISEHVIRIAVAAPQQRIDAFSAPELRARLDQLLENGTQRFVLDLSAVPFLDSAGMAVLGSLLKRGSQAGGDVRLVWPAEEAARRILRLTKFDRVFTIVDSVDAAMSDL
jgi:anti-sigma B factor antagonist